MKVSELIEVLQTMPQDANVWHVWDGEPRTQIKHVWLSRQGDVVTADGNQVVYSTEARPIEAPSRLDAPHWSTHDDGEYAWFGIHDDEDE